MNTDIQVNCEMFPSLNKRPWVYQVQYVSNVCSFRRSYDMADKCDNGVLAGQIVPGTCVEYIYLHSHNLKIQWYSEIHKSHKQKQNVPKVRQRSSLIHQLV